MASDKEKKEDDIFSFGESSDKKDEIKTNFLGHSIKFDPVTAGVGAIALLALGFAGYQWYTNNQKQNQEQQRIAQMEQQKHARYLNYLRDQERLMQQKKEELIAKQNAPPPQQRNDQIEGYSYDDPSSAPAGGGGGGGRHSYDELFNTPNQYSNLSSLNLDTPDLDPYHKTSRFRNTYGQGGGGAPLQQHTLTSRGPPTGQPQPPMQIQPDIVDYNQAYNGPSSYDNMGGENSQKVDTVQQSDPNMLPVEFSQPIQPQQFNNQGGNQNNQNGSQPSLPSPGQLQQQHQRPPQNQQPRKKQQQEEYGVDSDLSPDALMGSINNSSYYN